jgi:hypothetical protein
MFPEIGVFCISREKVQSRKFNLLINPSVKLAPVTKANAKYDTLVAAAVADFSAEKADDADWIVSIFAPTDRADVKSMLADKAMRARNREIFGTKMLVTCADTPAIRTMSCCSSRTENPTARRKCWR